MNTLDYRTPPAWLSDSGSHPLLWTDPDFPETVVAWRLVVRGENRYYEVMTQSTDGWSYVYECSEDGSQVDPMMGTWRTFSGGAR